MCKNSIHSACRRISYIQILQNLQTHHYINIAKIHLKPQILVLQNIANMTKFTYSQKLHKYKYQIITAVGLFTCVFHVHFIPQKWYVCLCTLLKIFVMKKTNQDIMYSWYLRNYSPPQCYMMLLPSCYPAVFCSSEHHGKPQVSSKFTAPKYSNEAEILSAL